MSHDTELLKMLDPHRHTAGLEFFCFVFCCCCGGGGGGDVGFFFFLAVFLTPPPAFFSGKVFIISHRTSTVFPSPICSAKIPPPTPSSLTNSCPLVTSFVSSLATARDEAVSRRKGEKYRVGVRAVHRI